MAFSISVRPPSSLILRVEKFVCAPAPFQSPCKVTLCQLVKFQILKNCSLTCLHGLGVHGDHDTEVLSNTVEEEAAHPEVISHLDALAGSNLELPLGGHDLGVGAGDVDAGVHAGAVVRLHDVTTVDLVGTHTAVVGALGSGEAVLGPSERMLVLLRKKVLELKQSQSNFLF